ncbi:phosphopantetheine-binding protein [Paremcibacter congregatus]|jgi:acyl carrier protein|uniref:Acyl carrier protein n=1 Tax=Paremcibacter congregatus TaxID=2043170 RepID=A0A2G4YUT9_9PROT|nr:phosphopantetheine-binding protein [Paremcibacter congregatus]PHZ86053.1 acyl carrier protein [Paremcibacter congregatus]QDE27019.1 acyl carrier protein [Paremcibacter congregatus]|tara:strand:- start:341 stop:592 length:252 start_codon:yes stop_codon:yes gene_type:complete
MSTIEEVREILRATLQIADRADDLERDTPLLGNIPELDSMAVAMLVTSMEEHFDIFVDDDDISAETFETFGSLCDFAVEKVAE